MHTFRQNYKSTFLTIFKAMPSTKRTAVRQELTNSLPGVLPLILNVLQHNGQGDVTVQAIKCLQAWVQFGIPMQETAPLVDRLLASVQDEELFDSSLDALSSIISHPETHKYVNLLKGFLEKILGLEGFLAQLLGEGSFEMATPLVSLFVTFGETHSRMLIDWSTESEMGKQATVRLVRIVLAVSSCNAQYPTQETISEMPFGFWYIFQDDMIACEPPQFQVAISTFGPIYEELVNSLMRKAMYSLTENEWTADQRETFRCYRTDIADTIMYCYVRTYIYYFNNIYKMLRICIYKHFFNIQYFIFFPLQIIEHIERQPIETFIATCRYVNNLKKLGVYA